MPRQTLQTRAHELHKCASVRRNDSFYKNHTALRTLRSKYGVLCCTTALLAAGIKCNKTRLFSLDNGLHAVRLVSISHRRSFAACLPSRDPLKREHATREAHAKEIDCAKDDVSADRLGGGQKESAGIVLTFEMPCDAVHRWRTKVVTKQKSFVWLVGGFGALNHRHAC